MIIPCLVILLALVVTSTSTAVYEVGQLSQARYSPQVVQFSNGTLITFGGLSVPRMEIYQGSTCNMDLMVAPFSTAMWIQGVILEDRWMVLAASYERDLAFMDIVNGTKCNITASVTRQSSALVTIKDLLIIAGGQDVNTGIETGMVEIWSQSTHTWFPLTYLSEPRSNPLPLVVGDKVVFAGGIVWTGFMSIRGSNSIDIYDTISKNWTFSRLPANISRVCGSSNATHAFFLITRYDLTKQPLADYALDFFIFNVATHEWTNLTLPLPHGAGFGINQMVTSPSGRYTAIGGSQSVFYIDKTIAANYITLIDHATSTISVLGDLPWQSRYDVSLKFPNDEQIWIIGGVADGYLQPSISVVCTPVNPNCSTSLPAFAPCTSSLQPRFRSQGYCSFSNPDVSSASLVKSFSILSQLAFAVLCFCWAQT